MKIEQEHKTRKTLKGAVLFTILTVMMLMVILVTVAIALAGVASKKAYSNWYENQTTYTAQSLVDGIIESLKPDQYNSAIGNSIVSQLTTPGKTVELDVSSNGSNYIPGYGEVKSLTFTYVAKQGDKYYISGLTGASSSNQKIIKVTAVVEMGGQTSTYSRYVIGSGKSGRIDSNGGGYNATNSNAGGAGSDTSPNVYGHYYAGISGAFDADSALGNKFSAAGDIFYNVGYGRKLIMNQSGGKLTFGRNDPAEGFYSGLAVVGDIDVEGTQNYYSQYDKDLAVRLIAKGTSKNDKLQLENISNIPYIYATGKYYANATNINIDGPLNLYCDFIELNQSTLAGPVNIFCLGQSGNSKITLNASKLTKWASTVAGTEMDKLQSGRFYSKGNVEIDANGEYSLDGDLCVEGNLNIGKGTLKVGGSVYVGGSISGAEKITAAATYSGMGTAANYENKLKEYSEPLYNAYVDAFKKKKDMVAADGSIKSDVDVFQTLENLQGKYYDPLVTTVDAKGNRKVNMSQSKYKNGTNSANLGISPSWDGVTPITGSCTIDSSNVGSLPQQVVINPGAADICITFDASVNSFDNKKFIVDDSEGGSATFYIKNRNEFTFAQTKFITKYYNENTVTSLSSYPLSEDDAKKVPHIYLYADDDNPVTLRFCNGNCFLSGDVLAPSATFTWMTTKAYSTPGLSYTFFDYADVTGDGKVTEADKQLDKVTVSSDYVDVIGSIEVKDMVGVTNDFVYFYVDDPPFDGLGDLSASGYTWDIIEGYASY